MLDTILLFGFGLLFTAVCPLLEWAAGRWEKWQDGRNPSSPSSAASASTEKATCDRCLKPQHALFPVAEAMLLCMECHDELEARLGAAVRGDVIREGTED